jgi:hypothetical protein
MCDWAHSVLVGAQCVSIDLLRATRCVPLSRIIFAANLASGWPTYKRSGNWALNLRITVHMSKIVRRAPRSATFVARRIRS